MRARPAAPRNTSRPETEPPPRSVLSVLVSDIWSSLEPEDLEDAARGLCARRPGSRVAERLMERASYLRTMRGPQPADGQRTSALLLA